MRFRNTLLCLFFLPTLFAKGFEEPWGKDSDLNRASHRRRGVKEPSMVEDIANSLILFHQKVISPASGSRSNFRPTSSRYMQLAIKRYGFLKGFIMGCDRLQRENSEKWLYTDVIIDGNYYKFDPAWEKKHSRFSPESTLGLSNKHSK